MKRNGLFITFEGGEGSGKSTQLRYLSDRLQGEGHDVLVTREPGGTPEAEKLRALFVNPAMGDWSVMEQALLIICARAHHVRTLIQPFLDKGGIVLCDRFVDSTRVYQGYAGELGDKVIRELHKSYTHDIWPDKTFLLDLDPTIGLSRVAQRGGAEAQQRFEGYDMAFHQSIREGFLSCAEQERKRFAVIDADQPLETIQTHINAQVNELLT